MSSLNCLFIDMISGRQVCSNNNVVIFPREGHQQHSGRICDDDVRDASSRRSELIVLATPTAAHS